MLTVTTGMLPPCSIYNSILRLFEAAHFEVRNGLKTILPLLMHIFETVATKAIGESIWPLARSCLYSGRRKKTILRICRYSPVMY